MKKLIIILSTASLLTACGGSADKNTPETPVGTVQASDLQAEQDAEIQRAKKETIDSINLATIRQRTIDSMNAVALVKEAGRKNVTHHVVSHPASSTPAPASQPNTAPVVSTNTQQTAASTPAAATPTEEAAPAKKKGLNNAVKGALIGLGTGAAAGAIIGKENRGKGAIIGGVIGATGGAIGGAVIDKNKKKKAQQDSLDAANKEK